MTDTADAGTADIDLIVATVGTCGAVFSLPRSVRRAGAPVRAHVIIADQKEDERVVFDAGSENPTSPSREAQSGIGECLSGTLN